MNLYNNFGFYGQDSASNKYGRELAERHQMGQLFLMFSRWMLV